MDISENSGLGLNADVAKNIFSQHTLYNLSEFQSLFLIFILRNYSYLQKKLSNLYYKWDKTIFK